MKLGFSPRQDGRVHTHCVRCQAETVVWEHARYRCTACNHVDDRAIVIDPEVTWWLQGEEYCHSTAGVFIRNEGKLLFFERVKYPFGYTVPAGHIGPGESDEDAARRETFEETNIRLPGRLRQIYSTMIHQDSCPRGADSHLWQLYMADLPRGARVRLNSREGKNPVWLTPYEALRRPLISPVRYLLQRYVTSLSD